MRFNPVDAGVGDALAVDERLAGDELLRAGDEIALDHRADDVAIAGSDLRGHVAADNRLAAVVLLAVGVAEVDHDARSNACALHERRGFGHALRRVVHGLSASAQDDVAIGIAFGDEDGRLAVVRVAKKCMRASRGEHGVDGHLDIARGRVLESHRTGDAGDELTVHLALGCAGTDCAPAHQAGDILRRNHVEEFGACGHAHLGEVEQQAPSEAQAVLILNVPSRCGSFISPFHPIVVRGFSK